MGTARLKALVFLRYIGCPVCHLSMLEYREQYCALQEAGIDLFVVLQSTPEHLRAETENATFPYPIILDPGQKLYTSFSLDSAADAQALVGENTRARVQEAIARGLSHGAYEGNEMQLPAAFLTDPRGTVLWARYGAHVTDVPTVEEWLDLGKRFA